MDDEPIRIRCEIQEPDDLIVLDPTLVTAVDVTVGLKTGGRILVNSADPPEAFPHLIDRFEVMTVDASDIATRHGLGTAGHPIVNTAILGAFSSGFGLVGLEAVCAAIEEEVPLHPEQNEAAARDAATAVVHLGEVSHA